MNTRTATLTIAAAAAVAAALAGCNTSAGAGPITSATKTPTSSTTPATPTASTSTTVDPAAKEAQDRQVAELVWRRFNGLITTLETLPANQVEVAIAAVAVDPAATRMRNENAKFRREHKAGYGQAIVYVAWPQPINGRATAVLSDCQDGTQAGFLDTKTGSRLTVGTPNTPLRGTLQRTPDGWKVSNLEVLEGTSCTPGK